MTFLMEINKTLSTTLTTNLLLIIIPLIAFAYKMFSYYYNRRLSVRKADLQTQLPILIELQDIQYNFKIERAATKIITDYLMNSSQLFKLNNIIKQSWFSSLEHTDIFKTLKKYGWIDSYSPVSGFNIQPCVYEATPSQKLIDFSHDIFYKCSDMIKNSSKEEIDRFREKQIMLFRLKI
jgi:hypothetical protein